MSTYSQTSLSTATAQAIAQNFRGLNTAFNNFGWLRTTDTGQGVAPATWIQTISAVSGSGTVVTVTFDDTGRSGPAPAINMLITLVGVTTTTAYNGSYAIASVSGLGTTTATLTFASATTGTAVVTTATMNSNINFNSISHVAGNGTQAVYTYDDTLRFGVPLQPGMLITTSGCTTGGFNVTSQVIQAISGQGTTSATFTLTNSTNVTENETNATGQVTASNSTGPYYETWGTNDSLTKYYVKYTLNGSTETQLTIQIGTATSGTGTLTGTTSAAITLAQGAGTSGTTNFYSGDSANIRWVLWTGGYAVCLERSFSTSGTTTGTYYSLYAYTGSSTRAFQQTIFATGGATTEETSGVAAIVPFTATTGNFGANTLVSPVFPLVGTLGNPSINWLIFRNVDFATGVQVQCTVYNTLHTYLAVGYASSNLAALGNGTCACGLLMRYE